MDLPQDWPIFLHPLKNSHIFSSSNLKGKLITFACEYKCGQALAAPRQLALYLCSGQHQRQALGFKGELYGATVVDATLRIYISRWEEDGTIVCSILFLFTSLSAKQ